MCEVCDKLDSMVDCLESLHSIEELREAMISMTDDIDMITQMKNMSDNEIHIEFAINLLVHWADKYDAFPFEVISAVAKKIGDRQLAHIEEDE